VRLGDTGTSKELDRFERAHGRRPERRLCPLRAIRPFGRRRPECAPVAPAGTGSPAVTGLAAGMKDAAARNLSAEGCRGASVPTAQRGVAVPPTGASLQHSRSRRVVPCGFPWRACSTQGRHRHRRDGVMDQPAPPHPVPGADPDINTLCAHFEAQWRAGLRPRLEDTLGPAPEPARPELLRCLLGLELAFRHGQGDSPTAELSQVFRDSSAQLPQTCGSCAFPRSLPRPPHGLANRPEVRKIRGKSGFQPCSVGAGVSSPPELHGSRTLGLPQRDDFRDSGCRGRRARSARARRCGRRRPSVGGVRWRPGGRVGASLVGVCQLAMSGMVQSQVTRRGRGSAAQPSAP
jgi:hypothetical protein